MWEESLKRTTPFDIFTLNIKYSSKLKKRIRRKGNIFSFLAILGVRHIVTFAYVSA